MTQSERARVLEIDPKATKAQARSAFARLSKIHNPYREENKKKFLLLKEAYETWGEVPNVRDEPAKRTRGPQRRRELSIGEILDNLYHHVKDPRKVTDDELDEWMRVIKEDYHDLILTTLSSKSQNYWENIEYWVYLEFEAEQIYKDTKSKFITDRANSLKIGIIGLLAIYHPVYFFPAYLSCLFMLSIIFGWGVMVLGLGGLGLWIAIKYEAILKFKQYVDNFKY